MGSTTTTEDILTSRRHRTHALRCRSQLSFTGVGRTCVDLVSQWQCMQATLAEQTRTLRRSCSPDSDEPFLNSYTSAQSSMQGTQHSCVSQEEALPNSFHCLLELPQELLDQIHSAYCQPYQITFSYPPSQYTRNPRRHFRPLRTLWVRGPPSANFSMASSKIYSELEELRRDVFDGELQFQYDEVEGLNALHELCTNEQYSWVRERVIKLVIRGVKGLDFKGTAYFLDFWNDVAKPGTLPQLKEIDITYEAKRAKYIAKEADFELPTEEWFKVSAQEYIELFRQGEEDIEYEYPGELLQLRELKQLLVQNGNQNCEVFLTTRVTWKHLRDDNVVQEQNGHGSMQSVTFRVVSDDLEGIERSYQ